MKQQAEIYDLRKVVYFGGSQAVTLPQIFSPKRGTIMRCIAKENIFVYLPESIYQKDEKLRVLIEQLFEHVPIAEVI